MEEFVTGWSEKLTQLAHRDAFIEMHSLPQINHDCPGSRRHMFWAVAPWPALLHFWRGSPICYANSFWFSCLSCFMRMVQEGKLERNTIQRQLEKTDFCLWSCLPSIHPQACFAKTPIWPRHPRWNPLMIPIILRMKFKLLRLVRVPV